MFDRTYSLQFLFPFLFPGANISIGGHIFGLAGGFLSGWLITRASERRISVVFPILAPMRLSRGEQAFIAWSGLKGAVPILLASLAVVGGTDYAPEIYGIVFVVVLFSVVVQGTLVPTVASRLGVPMAPAGTDQS